MTLVLAHVGHLLIDLPMFLGPPAILGGALVISARRQRREGQDD